jgi:hypothetical protein
LTYAVMSFGGFIELGHSHYPIPWGALKYDTKLDGYITGISEQQIKDAPAFSDDAWSNRICEAETHRSQKRGATGTPKRHCNEIRPRASSRAYDCGGTH